MATILGGARNPKLIQNTTPRINSADVQIPVGFRGGKVLLPAASNEFYTVINQTMVVGTGVPIAPLISGQVPVLMGIRAVFNHATDALTIRRIGGGGIFVVNTGLYGAINFIFSPIGLVTSNVEHGLEAIQTSGVGQSAYLTAWGYYALVP